MSTPVAPETAPEIASQLTEKLARIEAEAVQLDVLRQTLLDAGTRLAWDAKAPTPSSQGGLWFLDASTNLLGRFDDLGHQCGDIRSQAHVKGATCAIFPPELEALMKRASEQADKLKAAADGLKAAVGAAGDRLGFWIENQRLHFENNGEWARHYSTVRMTVATFVITVCVTLITIAKPERSPYLPGAADGIPLGKLGDGIAVLWLTGALVFYGFTWHTFDRLNQQMKYRGRLAVGPRDGGRGAVAQIWLDWGSWAVTGISGYIAWHIGKITGMTKILQHVLVVLVALGSVFPFLAQLLLNRQGSRGD